MVAAKKSEPAKAVTKAVPRKAADGAKSTRVVGKASRMKGSTVDAHVDVDGYLAAVPADARAALMKLRKTIKAAAPKATEVISYQIPTFKHHGPLVAFAAFKDHCGFYVMSPDVMRAHAAELKDYDLGKASIRFPADKPLPAALVKKLVKARIAENETGGND